MDEDEDKINFQNGILDTKTGKLTPHTPKFLSTIQLPCNWLEEVLPTPVFDQFLETLTDGDTELCTLLMHFMGAVLSNVRGSRFKKALLLVGKGNTGKSQLAALFVRLLGRENAAECSLKKMEERFSETAVYMRRLVYSNERMLVVPCNRVVPAAARARES